MTTPRWAVWLTTILAAAFLGVFIVFELAQASTDGVACTETTCTADYSFGGAVQVGLLAGIAIGLWRFGGFDAHSRAGWPRQLLSLSLFAVGIIADIMLRRLDYSETYPQGSPYPDPIVAPLDAWLWSLLAATATMLAVLLFWRQPRPAGSPLEAPGFAPKSE